MSQWYIVVIPRETVELAGISFADKFYTMERKIIVHKRALHIMLDANDCHEYTIAREVGKNGYRHYQIRLQSSNPDFFDWCKCNIPTAHVEKAEVSDDRYERKGGDFWSSRDTVEIRKLRFGTPRAEQQDRIDLLRSQSDRMIDVWYDPSGNQGKSWLCGYLFEKGMAHYIPPYLENVKQIVQTTASLQMEQYRPILVIDVPRSLKWSESLYTALEAIKDGLIMDTRYSARTVNIRGTKLLVLTNTKIKLDQLSLDRWRINGKPYDEWKKENCKKDADGLS